LLASSVLCITGNPMTDSELLQAWLANYPLWRSDRNAWQTCKLICDLLTDRAKVSAILGTVENHVMYLCHDIGIPKSQFEEVEGCPSTARFLMARYFARPCPHCGTFVSLTMGDLPRKRRVQALNGQCLECGYSLAWMVISGKQHRSNKKREPKPNAQLRSRTSFDE
jgi:hypothetical protein